MRRRIVNGSAGERLVSADFRAAWWPQYPAGNHKLSGMFGCYGTQRGMANLVPGLAGARLVPIFGLADVAFGPEVVVAAEKQRDFAG